MANPAPKPRPRGAEWERRYYPQQITARRPVGEDVDGQIAAVLDRVKAQD